MNFVQNTNELISILYELHTEFLFESNNSLLIHKPQLSPLPFEALRKLSDSYSLYWVYSDIHVTQIVFSDWLTPS